MRIAKYLSILILLCFLGRSNAYAQSPFFTLMADKEEIEINFEIVHEFILVQMKFKGYIPLNFIFDTGATNTILFKKELTEIFQIPYDDNVQIYGADLSNAIIAKVCRRVPFYLEGIGNFTQDVLVMQENFFEMEQMTGYQIDGILGASIFKDFIFSIDYLRNVITVSKQPINEKKLIGYKKLDIEIIDDKPYLVAQTKTMSAARGVKLKYLMDTGAAVPLLIHENTSDSIELPTNLVSGVIGKGLGGELQGFLGKIETIEFDEFNFSNIVTSFQDLDSVELINYQSMRNGIIGNILLSRFTIIFDYRNQVAYLKPKKRYNKRFKTDKSGLIIFAHGRNLNNYVIHGVIEGSPADLAGLQEGDIIKSYRNIPASLFSLQDLNYKFQRREGKKIKLRIIRDSKKLKVSFKLKDIFE